MATPAREDVAGGSTGSVFEENEQHRICSTCVARTSKRKATPAKGAGAGPSKRQKQTSGGSKKGTGSRARPDNNKKLEILKMLDQKVSHAQIADRFKCSLRFIGTVKAGRQKVETATAAGCGSQKTARKGDFPEMDEIALDLLDKARKAKMPVTRDILRSFGRSARATLLADTATSAAVRERVEDFKAGERWAENFVKRNKIQSVRLHGEAGSVDKEAIKEGMEEIRALCENAEEDEQDQGGGGENTGRERRAPRSPPGYEELSSHFGALEAAAEDSGNGDAAFYLTKAKMSMIAAHSARRVRQADMREFVVT